MTVLLTADEAARLVPGERLVIVRAGDEPQWEYQDEHNRWHKGTSEIIAPQPWLALSGQWEGQIVLAGDKRFAADGGIENGLTELTEDGRRIVPLWTDCPRCLGYGRISPDFGACARCAKPTGEHGDGRVLVGRGSIEVVPVVYQGRFDTGERPCVMVENANSDRAWLAGSQLGDASEHGSRQAGGRPPADRSARQPVTLNPLPVPGRDFGVVIDCVEVAP